LSEHRPDIGPPSHLLLSTGDPSPVNVLNQGGRSPFLLLGDHAGRAIPRSLGDLGLPSHALDLHIAWDIGVEGVGRYLSYMLDACFISQTYSRLVIDCNRQLTDPSSIPTVSDGITIPGNTGLMAEDLAARQGEIYQPYHVAIDAELERRAARKDATVLVSLHSFTPIFQGFVRPWRYGVLHRNDSRLSSRVLRLLKAELGVAAGDNQPYALDEKDNTVPLHADPRQLDYLELEVRQDLIVSQEGQADAAAMIKRLLIMSQTT
jgi:predicted N-formylglutamate amidohydrolase